MKVCCDHLPSYWPPSYSTTAPVAIWDTCTRSLTAIVPTYVGDVHAMNDATEEDKDFGAIYFKYLARGLEQKWLKAHNPEVVPGGLNGVEEGLRRLRDGKASAVKYVFRISETQGAGQ